MCKFITCAIRDLTKINRKKLAFSVALGIGRVKRRQKNGGLLLHFAIMFDKRAEYYERAMVAKDHVGRRTSNRV